MNDMTIEKHGTIRASPRGDRFDFVLRSEGSGCKFFRTQCNHCETPTLTNGPKASRNRDLLVETITELDSRAPVKQANLFGCGSVLDGDEITDETFAFALSHLTASFPSLECLGVDTRPEIALSRPSRTRIDQALELISSVRFELVIGYETQDVHLRTHGDGLNKKITERHMQQVFALAKQLGLGLQINVMLMPVPTMSLPEAVEEAVKTIQHVRRLQETCGVPPVLINLNPLYITRRMIEKFGSGILDVPLPSEAEIDQVLTRCKGILPIFVGLDDEGLALKKAF